MVPVTSSSSDLFQKSVTYRFDQDEAMSNQSMLEIIHGISGIDVAFDIHTVRSPARNTFEVTFESFAKKQEATIKIRTTYNQVNVHGYGLGTYVTCLNVPAYLDEGILQATLSRYGKISMAKCPTYPPPFDKIKKGIRQYRMELESNIPNALRIGNAIIWVKYVGQEQVCNKCGEKNHFYAQCPYKKCSKCLEFGHVASECEGEIRCTVCNDQGHTYKSCPKSYARITSPGNTWTKGEETKSVDENDKSEDVPQKDEETEVKEAKSRAEALKRLAEHEETYIQCMNCEMDYAVGVNEYAACHVCKEEFKSEECKMKVCDNCSEGEQIICVPCFESENKEESDAVVDNKVTVTVDVHKSDNVSESEDVQKESSSEYSINPFTSSNESQVVESEKEKCSESPRPSESQVSKKPIPARRKSSATGKKSDDISYSPLENTGNQESQSELNNVPENAENETRMEWKVHTNKRSRSTTDSSEDIVPQKKKTEKTALINKAKDKLSKSRLIKNEAEIKCEEKPCSGRGFHCPFKKFANHNKVHHKNKPIALKCLSPSCGHLSKSPSEWASHICTEHPEDVTRKRLTELESWFI